MTVASTSNPESEKRTASGFILYARLVDPQFGHGNLASGASPAISSPHLRQKTLSDICRPACHSRDPKNGPPLVPLSTFAHQLRQLSKVHSYPPCLVTREHLRRRSTDGRPETAESRWQRSHHSQTHGVDRWRSPSVGRGPGGDLWRGRDCQ